MCCQHSSSRKPSCRAPVKSNVSYSPWFDACTFAVFAVPAPLTLTEFGMADLNPLASLPPPPQDYPVVDDVRLTLDYDLDAPLSAPRWLDGYQAFLGLPYHPGLVLLLDVRCLVPGSSTAAPAGWACLPVFEAAGAFVASGVYHLPLFQVRRNASSGVSDTEASEGGRGLAECLDLC